MKRYYRGIKKRLQLPFRLLTAGIRSLPHFIIIVSIKFGTNSLYAYLVQHPQVMGTYSKEVHFFDHKFRRGTLWYRMNFPTTAELSRKAAETRKRVLTGEASPYYLFHPYAPRRIAEVAPEAQLIVLLRDPVHRAYSHYHHMLSRGRENLTFEEAIEKEKERLGREIEKMRVDESYQSYNYRSFSYLSRGIYVDQLMAYEKYFAREQMLILKSEDFFQNAQGIYDRVSDFLGLERYNLRKIRPYNVGSYSSLNAVVAERLYAFFRPHNQRLYERLGIDFGWECSHNSATLG